MEPAGMRGLEISGPDATAALETLYQAYSPRLLRLARRLLGNAADADDAVQDAFVQAQAGLAAFRGESSLPTWFYRLAVNAILAYRRQRAVRDRHRIVNRGDGRLLENATPAAPTDPTELTLEHEREQLVDEAVAHLPADQREVVVLADLDELPLAHVAELLGLTEPAVKSRLHRARAELRRRLGRRLGEPAPGAASEKESRIFPPGWRI